MIFFHFLVILTVSLPTCRRRIFSVYLFKSMDSIFLSVLSTGSCKPLIVNSLTFILEDANLIVTWLPFLEYE